MSIVGKMHIDGVFEGSIRSIDSVSVGRRGQIIGQVRAQTINVCGRIDGEVHCEELVVENGGHVNGVVFSKDMIVERRGSFIGERHQREESAARLERSVAITEGSETLLRTLEELPDKITLR